MTGVNTVHKHKPVSKKPSLL